MESRLNVDTTSFLYKSLRRLYYYAQIFGCASFSYNPRDGLHMRFVNFVTFILAFSYYISMSYINGIAELSIDAKGYQSILFSTGVRGFFAYVPFLIWNIIFNLFVCRKYVAKLMEDILTLVSEVRQIKLIFFLHS